MTTAPRRPAKFEFWLEFGKRALLGLSLFIALVVGLALFAPSTGHWVSRSGPVAVQTTKIDQSTLSYHDGAWYVNGRPVMISCPTEDACATQVLGDVLWVVRVPR